ncbi:MAG TPA: type IV toxin-antitoxin system AbiEi family antitoxin domain-containing protein [Acidimicrobiia bacterium]|nr:type IV toxin-antitoxin system AbiEi family antitoxin domain-containing protein [Acidimicrobiia bacterium]
MANGSAFGRLSLLSADSLGVFRGRDALAIGVTRKQIAALHRSGVVDRILPDTYRMTAVARSNEQSLRAALLWAGDGAAAAGRSAGELYKLEGVTAQKAEIVVVSPSRVRSASVLVHEASARASLLLRRQRGLLATGVEPTILALAASLDAEGFEIACEDARRRRLTTVPALRAYLGRFSGRPGSIALRQLLDEIDPVHAARSTLEVKTRRLLVAAGLTDFVREFPLTWNGRTYRFDFAFTRARTILETNGRRWHDDATDYEHDNEKWSVPGRPGYRLVFATWDKVTGRPEHLLHELYATLAA